nr:transposase [Streptomyces caniscabiei]
MPLATLVRLANLRWRIEHDYREMKQALGLAHFEARTWTRFRRAAGSRSGSALVRGCVSILPGVTAPGRIVPRARRRARPVRASPRRGRSSAG